MTAKRKQTDSPHFVQYDWNIPEGYQMVFPYVGTTERFYVKKRCASAVNTANQRFWGSKRFYTQDLGGKIAIVRETNPRWPRDPHRPYTVTNVAGYSR